MSSSSEKLRADMRERSAMRKALLKQTLGVNEDTSLAEALGNVHNTTEAKNKIAGQSYTSKVPSSCEAKTDFSSSPSLENKLGIENKIINRNRLLSGDGLDEVKRLKTNRCQRSPSVGSGNTSSCSVVRSEGKLLNRTDQSETPSENIGEQDDHEQEPLEFRDSTAFLKGTQSMNPHNDYSQNFVDTGQRPQNFIRDVGLADRFEEYPKLKELIKLKDEIISERATPPM